MPLRLPLPSKMTSDRSIERPSRRRLRRLFRIHDGVAPFYFVTFNTYNRLLLLANPDVHMTFYAFCVKAEVDYSVAVGRYVLNAGSCASICLYAADRHYVIKMGQVSAHSNWKDTDSFWFSKTALAGRFFRSCPSKRRKLFAEMGLRSNEPSPCWTLQDS